MSEATQLHGGILAGEVLARHGVRQLFTLCGGHISPLLLGCQAQGILVIDVRHEATAVFAADASARLTGIPGVAAVTAGPGLTNTITAVKNAQLAQSPVVILGGAAATLLQGRGALQDIDQLALMRPHVKWARAVRQVAGVVPALEEAFVRAQAGVPGPVFVELPLDVLYPEALVREFYEQAAGRGRSLAGRIRRRVVERHAQRLFTAAWERRAGPPESPAEPVHLPSQLARARALLETAERPVLLVGSQALYHAREAAAIQEAVRQLGLPTFLSGMARGLLGPEPLWIRHRRRQALREADLVLLAGVACDFRLGYGRQFNRAAALIAVNRSRADLRLNCRPDLAIWGDPGRFLQSLSQGWGQPRAAGAAWLAQLRARDAEREAEIAAQAAADTDYVNPLALCQAIEAALPEDSVLVGDGGDFVATASYIVRPRGPLRWLDPGPFGTLGVGAGFALAARLARPTAEVWLLYGDGSAAYSLAEFDSYVRHGLPVIAVVGTDASWAQIARDQVAIFGDPLGTVLRRTDYHRVAQGYGGAGFLVTEAAEIAPTLRQAQAAAAGGRPALVNVYLGATDFRQGSISI